MTEPAVDHVYIDLTGCEDATVVTITGPDGVRTFAIPVSDGVGQEQTIVGAAKTGYRRYLESLSQKND